MATFDPKTFNFKQAVSQDPAGNESIFKEIASGNFNFPNMLRVSFQLLLVVIAVSSFVFLLWGALQWILAGGDKEGITKAQRKITHAIVGLLITFSLFAILALIQVITGIDLAGNLKIPELNPPAVTP